MKFINLLLQGKSQNLPDPMDGVLLIVSTEVANSAAVHGRSTADLLVSDYITEITRVYVRAGGLPQEEVSEEKKQKFVEMLVGILHEDFTLENYEKMNCLREYMKRQKDGTILRWILDNHDEVFLYFIRSVYMKWKYNF